MMPVIGGYVLAGGESSRMQGSGMPSDKALLLFEGQPLLQRALRIVHEACGNAAVLCGTQERGARLRHLGRTVEDISPGCGPLGGIEAALSDALEDWVLVAPVDLPLLPARALRSLVEAGMQTGSRTVCLQAGQYPQPLPVLLRRNALPAVRAALARGERKLMPVLHVIAEAAGTGAEWLIPAARFASQQEVSTWFLNLNTPGDYRAACELPRRGNGFAPGASE